MRCQSKAIWKIGSMQGVAKKWKHGAISITVTCIYFIKWIITTNDETDFAFCAACFFCCTVAGGYGTDTASLAMDYRLVGFRECAAAVSRYLVSIEGMDLQDPLRLRLISHLQCFSAQREASAKACGGGVSSLQPLTGCPPSGPAAAPPPPPPHPWNQHHQYSAPPQASAPTAVMPMHNANVPHPGAFDQSTGGGGTSYLEALGRGPAPVHHQSQHHVDAMRLTSTVGGVNPAAHLSVSSPATGSSPPTQQSAAAASLFGVHHAAQFLGAAAAAGMNSMPMLSPNGLHYGSSAAAAAMLGQGVKPYRPWGTELVY